MNKLPFNKALRILLITNGLILIAGAMLIPIYAFFVEQIGGNLLDAGLTGGVFAIAAGITTLLSGKFTDKSERKGLIVVFGYLTMGTGFLLLIFVNSIWFLFGIQILIGFSTAFYSPAFDVLYTNNVTETKVGREWAAWEAINHFSVAIGAIIGGFIANSFGFNAIFIIMAILCFISGGYLLCIHKKTL
jgi:MFS family permease